MLVLLDFDGVINAVSKNPPRNIHPLDTWNQTICVDHGVKETEYPIMYSTAVIDFINELSKDNDVVWLTTWRKDTAQFKEKLGIVDLPFADELTHKPDPLEWWKYGIAKKLIEDKPFVWIDDEFKYGRTKEQTELIGHCHPHLCIGPVITYGLTMKEMTRIKQFCEDY